MTEDVGHCLAQCQAEHLLHLGRQDHVVEMNLRLNLGSRKRRLCPRNLRGEVHSAHSEHRLAHLRQRLACRGLNVAHLLLCALRVDWQNAICKLSFQCDQCQRMSKQVVQVARNALTFCGCGKVFNLVLRPLHGAVVALLSTKREV